MEYQDIIERPNAYHHAENTFTYQWRTKAKEWAYEQEVRLVMPNPSAMYAALTPEQAEQSKQNEVMEWKEVHHYMPLKGDCFESIYFGVNTEPTIKEKLIQYARKKLNPQINLYQMRVDANAFRLLAEEIWLGNRDMGDEKTVIHSVYVLSIWGSKDMGL